MYAVNFLPARKPDKFIFWQQLRLPAEAHYYLQAPLAALAWFSAPGHDTYIFFLKSTIFIIFQTLSMVDFISLFYFRKITPSEKQERFWLRTLLKRSKMYFLRNFDHAKQICINAIQKFATETISPPKIAPRLSPPSKNPVLPPKLRKRKKKRKDDFLTFLCQLDPPTY